MNSNSVIKLLENSKRLTETYMQIATNRQEQSFNIFYIEGIAHKEVMICRLLRELLDPKGTHGMGGLFLSNFFDRVLHIEGVTDNVDSFMVDAEYLIDNQRRIDLCIRNKDCFYPIEVKVYAGDQDVQCSDYYKYAREKFSDTRIYYLTIDGHEPNTSSKGELVVGKQLICISFENDIAEWLDYCIDSIQRTNVVKNILVQFRDVVNNWSKKEGVWERMTSDDKEKLIGEVSSSKEMFNAAIAIENAVVEAKINKMKEIFQGIAKHMSKNNSCFQLEERYVKNVEDFYKKNRNTWPSLNYIIPLNKFGVEKKVVLRFEIAERLFYGITPWSGDNNWDEAKDEDVATIVTQNGFISDHATCYKGGNWYWWKYLDENINFRNLNEQYYALYDSDNYMAFQSAVYEEIDKYIEGLLKELQSRIEE